MSNEIKMSRVSIPESDYMQINKSMKENNERNFIDYLKRQEAEKDSLQTKLQESTLRFLELTEKHKVLEDKLNNSVEHNHFLASELGKTSSELRESKKKYSTLEYNLEVVIRDDNNRIKELENKLLFAKDEIAEKSAEINSLSERVTSFRILLSDKDNKLAESAEHELSLRSELEQVNKEYCNLIRDVQENLEKMVRMTESNQLLEQQLKSLRTFKGRIKNLFSK
ncbi:MAG: hypothetical protein UIQ67_05960 [Bacteroidales bacterium]|nr:hypothetical protein [Bacteroidales bacterium]